MSLDFYFVALTIAMVILTGYAAKETHGWILDLEKHIDEKFAELAEQQIK